MLRYFYPAEYVNSAYGIDFEQLYRQGYRGVIFDIDNTLVAHGAPADARALALFERLKKLGYRCCLLSNNKEPRVQMFNEKIKAEYIFKAHKPRTANYKKAMELMKTNKDNTLFVGDQIFTDIWGANLAGVRTFLVKPLNPKEEIQIVLKRFPEKIVLHYYRKSLKRNQHQDSRHSSPKHEEKKHKEKKQKHKNKNSAKQNKKAEI